MKEENLLFSLLKFKKITCPKLVNLIEESIPSGLAMELPNGDAPELPKELPIIPNTICNGKNKNYFKINYRYKSKKKTHQNNERVILIFFICH